MTPEMFLDFLAIRLDAKKAAGKTLSFGLILDAKKTQEFTVTLENSVLNYSTGKPSSGVDGSIELDMATLAGVGSGKLKLSDAVQQKKAKVTGDQKKLEELLGLFSTFDFWFPIVTP